MRDRICLTLWMLVAAAALPACREPERPNPILDDQGRIVLYHGLNVANSAKYAPDHLPWQTREDLERLREWGFNHVRYLMFWEAVEPAQDVFDDAYLDAVAERIGWLADLGIDVTVDLHQDLYGQHFGSHGFPDWATDDGGRDYTPLEPWNVNYFQPAMWGTFDNFWRSDELKAQYVAMLEHVLDRLDALPNVVGLDIMNEPWPTLGLSFEADFLTGFYDRVQAMRRERGFKTPLYFEPMVIATASGLRFQPDAGSVYYPHYYDPLAHEGLPYTAAGNYLLRLFVEQRVHEACRFGTPLMFGEFGIGTSVEGYGDYLTDFMNLMNEFHLGWTYWSYDKDGFGILNPDGTPKGNLAYLIYVYPQRIAGRNPEMRYAPGRFYLAYDPIDTPAPTLLFIPAWLSNIRVTANGVSAAFDPASSLFEYKNSDTTSWQTIEVAWDE